MSLKTRIDKAEAETKERLGAEWEAAQKPVLDLFDQASKAEQAAFWRVWRQNEKLNIKEEQWLLLCDGVLEPQPGDDELIAAFEARVPSAMMERLKAAAEAANAAGISYANGRGSDR